MSRALTTLMALCWVAFGCSNAPPPSQPEPPQGYEQQRIVDRAAASVRSMRQNPRLAVRFEALLAGARAVVVFPRLVKASLVFGGEGGNGVMALRRSDGSWSPPAFYSIGAASAGLQIGYQEASVVLLFMRDGTVERALDSDFRLGADASAAVGYIGEGGEGVTGVASRDIYAFTEVGGAFVGVSFEGHVMGPRRNHNQAYYGRAVTPREILIDGGVDVPGSAVLKEALAPPAPGGTPVTSAPAAASAEPTRPASSTELRPCSPESRQAAACAEIYQPVCADLGSGAFKTFPNACGACRDASVPGYRDGACPGG